VKNTLEEIKYRHERYNWHDRSCSWECAEAGGQANRDCGTLIKMVEDLKQRIKDVECEENN
jgi:hypothetical protein